MRLHLMNFSQWQGYTLISYVTCQDDKKMELQGRDSQMAGLIFTVVYDLNTVS